MGIGRGGSRSTAAKKSASQRTGLRRVHQRTGTMAAGAARSAFMGRLRVTAIAAAQMPKSAGVHHAGRGCDALVMGGPLSDGAVAKVAPASGPRQAEDCPTLFLTQFTHHGLWPRR